MKKIKKRNISNYFIYSPLIIFICVLFMSVGYATVNSVDLFIDGSGVAMEQTGLFISEAVYSSDNNANVADSSVKLVSGTVLNSTISLSSNPVDTDSSITYKVTIYNADNFNYKFVGAVFDSSFYDNSNITFEISDELNTDVILEPTDSIIFYITFKYVDGVTPSESINTLIDAYVNFKFEFDTTVVASLGYTGAVENFVVPETGTYKVELWGASGGGNETYSGGLGSYTSGDIYLTEGTSFNIVVGSAGTETSSSYNGGGDISSGYGSYGGGATDIRTNSSVLSRIMVAAGGGGAGHRGENYGDGNGGAGGGLTGIDGVSINNSYNYGYAIGTGGTQTSGGLMYWKDTGSGNRETGYYSETYSGTNLYYCGGSFSTGGDAASTGGGGYYGGGAAFHGGAGGGSSFISGHEGCDAIDEISTETLITHTGQSIHYSGYTFTNTIMIDGEGYSWTTEKSENSSGMPSFDGTSTMTGNDGNGYAKITLIEISE